MENNPVLNDGHLLVILPLAEGRTRYVMEWIRSRHPKLKVTYKQALMPTDLDEGELAALWRECTILTTLFCYPQHIEAVPNLRLIHHPGAGIDEVRNSPVFSKPYIRITTSKGIAAPAISEWFVAQLLNHTRRLDKFRLLQKVRTWNQSISELSSVHDLVGQRLGVLGYGSIGRQCARIAQAMGMEVWAYTAGPRASLESREDRNYVVRGTGDPHGSIPTHWFSGTDKQSLHRFLSQGLDVLLISVPLTDKSKALIGADEFKVLKENSSRGCFLANISRGDVIVQEDLIQALEDGNSGLAGAALDVVTPEPLPKSSPLWTTPRCSVTPHMSGIQGRYAERVFTVLDENLHKTLGEKLINEIEKSQCY